jgi:dihydrofolate reductase
MKLILYPAISLDGFIAKKDGDSDTWISQGDDVRYRREVERCGFVLVGRKTFELYWGDVGWPGVVTFLCTSKMGLEDSDSIKYLSGSGSEIRQKLEDFGCDEVVVCGGGELNGRLASDGVIDEIVISVQPVVLGEGIPLFGKYKPKLKLELLSSNEDIPGVVQNRYLIIKN